MRGRHLPADLRWYELFRRRRADYCRAEFASIKPWFHGKLDFAPTVTDLSKDGFVLAGGRLDYVNGRPVAALVYHRRKHVINLLIWPAKAGEPDASLTSETKQGYHVVHWRREGMDWWAVSDLNVPELTEFARRLQGRE